ncbi:PIN domain-containing protein [Peribacillus frigoritolerans]|uniref:PIN domain-containing protein n=1 Tax=Peribacillus frigoritolerans TaxID=450367 RepID=UPI00351200FA
MSYIFPFDEFKELWESSPLVVIDTNGFLNLYRYSTETTSQILEILDTVPKEQFWLPAQVIKEYNKNRQDVINREHSKYKEVTKEVERIMLVTKNDIDKQFSKFNKFRFPKVKDFEAKIYAAIESIKEESKNYKEEIKGEVKQNEKMLSDDKVKKFIDLIINSERVGEPFNITQLLQIYSEGEQRYQYKVPPGYMDLVKDNKDNTKREKFGDLILWKQLLNQAQESNDGIIFITNDEKEDWWVLDKNDIPLRPRAELFVEFKEYSDQPLVIMNLTNFINHVSIINNMVDHTTHIEMNADEISEELIAQKGWEEVLYDKGDLTSYLIHGGDLQSFVSNPIADVEITEYLSPEITIESVDVSENQVIIEGTFETRVELNITESFSKNYSREVSAPNVLIRGYISFEFDVDFEKDEDFIMTKTLNIVVSGFEVLECDLPYEEFDEELDESCIRCGNPDTVYFTNNGDNVCERCSIHYESCPECGRLFEQGTLGGAFCRTCELVRKD